VRGEIDGDFVVDVKPFGVVVHSFRNQRDTAHEPECLDKVLELKLLVELPFLN